MLRAYEELIDIDLLLLNLLSKRCEFDTEVSSKWFPVKELVQDKAR